MPIATRSRTGKLPQKVVQSVEDSEVQITKKTKKRENRKSKKLNDENDVASSPSKFNLKNYHFNSTSGATTYFSFKYHPLRRNNKNNSVPNSPVGNGLSSPVPFAIREKNLQDMPGASMNGVNI